MYLFYIVFFVSGVGAIQFDGKYLSQDYFPVEFMPPSTEHTLTHIPKYSVLLPGAGSEHVFLQRENWENITLYFFGDKHPGGNYIAFEMPSLKISIDGKDITYVCQNFRTQDGGFRPKGEWASAYISWARRNNIFFVYITFGGRGKQCTFDLPHVRLYKLISYGLKITEFKMHTTSVYTTNETITSDKFSLKDDVMVASTGCRVNVNCGGTNISGVVHPLYKNLLSYKQDNSSDDCIMTAASDGFVACQITAPYYAPWTNTIELFTPSTTTPPPGIPNAIPPRIPNAIPIPPLPARRPPVLERQQSSPPPARCPPVHQHPAPHEWDENGLLIANNKAIIILIVLIFVSQMVLLGLSMVTALFVYRWRLHTINTD
jgi:hypothetical protein